MNLLRIVALSLIPGFSLVHGMEERLKNNLKQLKEIQQFIASGAQVAPQPKQIKSLVKLSASAAVYKGSDKNGTLSNDIRCKNVDAILKHIEKLPKDLYILVMKKIINQSKAGQRENDRTSLLLAMLIHKAFGEKGLSIQEWADLNEYHLEKERLVEAFKIIDSSIESFEMHSDINQDNDGPLCFLSPLVRSDVLQRVKGSVYINAFGKLFHSFPIKPHHPIGDDCCCCCDSITCLSLLARGGNTKLMRWILEYDKRIQFYILSTSNHEQSSFRPKIDVTQSNLLYESASSLIANFEMFKLLCEFGANPSFVPKDKRPLQDAIPELIAQDENSLKQQQAQQQE